MADASARGSVVVVGRPAVTAGFALAGVDVAACEPPSDIPAVVELLGQPDVAVIFLEEDIFDRLGDDLHRRIERVAVPIVVPFPSPGRDSAAAADRYIADVLERAIGYRVRPT